MLTMDSMLALVARRAAFAVLALLVVSAMLFTLVHMVPVSPARIVLGADATAAQLADFERQYGLDLPVSVQYLQWIGGALTGDFGRSYVTNLRVSTILAETLPVTLELVVLGFCFAVLVAIPLGLVSAFHNGQAIDHAARIFAVLGVSIPGFWLGLLLISYGSVQLGWFPPGGFVPLRAGLLPHLRSVALPAFALGFYYIAILSRMTRASMVEVLGQDYIRTARAMGVPRRRLWVYAIRNGLAPVVSVAAMSFGYMFGWALIIEHVFNIAGLSRALLSAIQQRDFLTVQAIVMVISVVFILANLAADLLHRLLTPRLANG
jgi:peptide/nickel transport system permease protein